MALLVPQPWIGSFASEEEFRRDQGMLAAVQVVASNIDDKIMSSRHPQRFPAYCVACGSIKLIEVNWRLVGLEPDGSVHPAWTETGTCESCGLNSRMRAVLSFVLKSPDYTQDDECYIAENLTPAYEIFSRLFRNLESSEFLGDYEPGERVYLERHNKSITHQDLTKLSFDSNRFKWVVTQDVFEHIPDYRAAFKECARVLIPGGRLVFTIPFNSSLGKTQVRALRSADGAIEHLLPPEVHGNPISGDGSLCYQNFGWDVLDTLRDSGFETAKAHLYWGPWQGHLGVGALLFCAVKNAGRP